MDKEEVRNKGQARNETPNDGWERKFESSERGEDR